jgi:hypothetical protein
MLSAVMKRWITFMIGCAISKDVGTKRKMEMLEMKNTVTKMNNAFNKLIK